MDKKIFKLEEENLLFIRNQNLTIMNLSFSFRRLEYPGKHSCPRPTTGTHRQIDTGIHKSGTLDKP